MAEGRELILKLGQKITDRIGHKVTVDDPEYWGLAGVITDEMAEVALSMKVRKPITSKEVAKRCGKDLKRTEELLQEMSVIGLLEYNWENEDRHKQYVLPMFVPGCAEFMNMNKEQVEAHPEIAQLFNQMSRLPLEKVTPMVPLGGAGIGMHVIPVEKAIPTEQQSVSIEHISHWVQKYKGKYAVGACSCRRSRRIQGEGCGHLEEDMCIGVGDMADYLVETNKGRYIDEAEVMEILQRAEDNGLVHEITNIDGEDKIFAICNCCVCSCYALRTSQLFNTPNLSRSAYIAKVDPDNCVACGQCVEYCPAGAVKLGQKLCTKDGPVAYPNQELPDAVKWGPEKWNENYRDDNQINCYDTGTSPCKTKCPAHIAVQGYLKMASQGRYLDALKLIKKENPFPAVCGSICNRRCEEACTRGTIDQAVAIDEVKKFIAMQELNSESRYIPPMINQIGKPYPQKIAVIGGGPAGMTCAFFLAQKGYPVTVFEKNKTPGGMLTYGIPKFRLEKDVVEAEIDVLREMGVEFKCGVEVGKDVTLDELRAQDYKAFYLAIGCQGGRNANVPGEDAEGVYTGVQFLHKVNNDENTKLSGRTVVVGGGNVAIDVARSAVRAGSSSVSMYCLEDRETMPAAEDEVAEAMEERITINNSWGPKEILTEDGKVTGIVFKKCTAVKDSEGRFNPQYDEEECITVECDNVLMSIGQSIIWGDLLKGSAVELGRGNGAVADSLTYQTAQPDIFVGGDVYTGPLFAIDAIAAGKEGAISIHRFVHEGQSLTIGRNRREFVELDKDNLDIPKESFHNSSRQRPGHRAGIDPTTTFDDTRLPFTEEQVKAETERCLGCGASVVDFNRCIGCGVCTTKCEFDAIHLNRELPDASRMARSEDKMKKILPYALKRQIKIIRNKNKVK
ncbi:MAG TPA: FAD-dependent oxidoreductase [Candidatus Pelethocola excrementipullorum]|nr:FAD-dependent oxidoreductase [Candidatus Pelethocola excrementipullorum]